MARLINNINNKFIGGTMKNLTFFFVSIIVFCNTLNAQETVELAQLFLGITGVGGSEVVYHTIDAEGVVWEKSGSNYIISEDEDIYSSTNYSTGNFTSGDSATRAPFNWVWLSQLGRVSPWGLGLYKITNSKVSGKYFYLDTRDNEYVESLLTNPDVWFIYNVTQGKYFCFSRCGTPPPPIENGSLVRVSDIIGFTSKTDKLEDFWGNALVIVNNGNNRPKLMWGKYPTSSVVLYLIYRDDSGSGNFTRIASVSNSTYTYTDNSVIINQPGQTIYYKVKPLGKEYTNTVSTTIIPYKIGTESEDVLTYSLSQNYPNPFNPATVISYSVAENSLITLKVYDVIGNEISELLNEVKEPGNYSVSFDASSLSSGIYFYTLKANGYSLTKKMLLAK